MPTFDAGTVDALNFDFTTWGVDAKGTIPEPSSEKVETFMAIVRQLMPTKVETGEDGKDHIVLDIEAIEEKFKDREDEAEQMVNAAYADVCSNTPTAEQIGALPYRVKQGFYGWLYGSLVSPEA